MNISNQDCKLCNYKYTEYAAWNMEYKYIVFLYLSQRLLYTYIYSYFEKRKYDQYKWLRVSSCHNFRLGLINENLDIIWNRKLDHAYDMQFSSAISIFML